jgi:hypothetical protein
MYDTTNTLDRDNHLNQTVSHYELLWEASLDTTKVEEYLNYHLSEGVDKNLVEIRQEFDKEKRLGAMIAKISILSEESNAPVNVLGMYATVLIGKDLINALDSFWMVKPTLEKIFELNNNKISNAKEIIDEYYRSDEYYAVNQKSDGLLSDIGDNWDKNSTEAENVRFGLNKYLDCSQILERTFPTLLAVKRVIDDKSPSLSNLHKLKSYKVRTELTNRDKNANSVYFDCIVKEYDSQLRNGLAHGDILVNPSNSVVEIPNANKEYEFSEINKILKKNFASMVFLTGMYRASIELQFIFRDAELEPRELVIAHS